MTGTERDLAHSRSAEAHMAEERRMERLNTGEMSELHFSKCQQIVSPRFIATQVAHFHPDTLRECELIEKKTLHGLTEKETQELEQISERQDARAEAALLSP